MGCFGKYPLLELHPQTRHREKDRGVGALQIINECVQRFGKENAAAKFERALLHQHALSHVGQRQVRQKQVFAAHLDAPGGAGQAPGHGVEGLHDALGVARGARGVDQRAKRCAIAYGFAFLRRVGGQQGVPCGFRHVGWRQRQGDQRHAAGHAFGDVVGIVQFADKAGARFAVVKDVAQRLGIEGGVNRHRYVSGHPDRQVSQNPMGAVFAQDRHVAAYRPALRREPGGNAPGFVARLRPGDVAQAPATQRLGQENFVSPLALPAVKRGKLQVGG